MEVIPGKAMARANQATEPSTATVVLHFPPNLAA